MLTLAARHVFPVEGTPIADGRVSIADGRIVRVGGADDAHPVDLDLGNVAITPGFVNAHTHLELGPIAPATGQGPEDEIAWLGRVIASRRGSSGAEIAGRNVDDCVAFGTTTLADTTTAGQSWDAVAGAALRGVVFAELLGLGRARGLETSGAAFDWLATVRSDEPEAKTRPGLSPHAPYSTAGWLYHRAAAAGLPLSTHLAEMPEEAELLRTRGGRLRRFLDDLGAWDPGWDPIGPRPADYIRRGDLRKADWIVAHANYFEPDEFWQLRPEAAPDGQRVAVAYCPRTHARFGHAPHPYRAMLERGIIVCLGTDSLASAPDLSVLAEARFLAARDESARGDLLLTMATLFGAWALRADHVAGSLKAGKSADLAVVALPDTDDPDPYSLLLHHDGPVLATMFQGEFVHGPWMA